jgi:hypothetical protein
MKFKYFFKEIIRGKTIGRALLFASLKELFATDSWLNDNYLVLEIGSESASHQRALPKKWNLKKSNYIKMPDSDYVVNAEDKFPFSDKEFDGVVIFNVLSVLNNYYQALIESLRVSKKFVIFNIPLISGIARHPKDFNRFTEDRLFDLLNGLRKEIKLNDFKIIPIGGSFSSAVSLIDTFLKFRIIRIPLYLLAILFDRLDHVIKRQCPMQYLVLIRKNDS